MHLNIASIFYTLKPIDMSCIESTAYKIVNYDSIAGSLCNSKANQDYFLVRIFRIGFRNNA